MIVVLTYCQQDSAAAIRCLSSLAHFERQREELGLPASGIYSHQLVLQSTQRMPLSIDEELVKIARRSGCFDHIEPIRNLIDREWPYVVNYAFLKAMQIQREAEQPMFWLEPDVTFVGPCVLDILENQWRVNEVDILGHLSQSTGLGLSMNGVAIYGGRAWGYLNDVTLTNCDQPFDLDLRSDILRSMMTTNLIGQLPKTVNVSAERAAQLVTGGREILWHGVKDDSLWNNVRASGLAALPPPPS